MTKLFLYNTLTRQKEEFKPIKKDEVGLYTCGPTVYNFAHLGNLRTYLFEDFLKRTLEYNGYKVNHVMNITDVGHLTGDMDMGEDKVERTSNGNLVLQCKNCKNNIPLYVNTSERAFETIEFNNCKIKCPVCKTINIFNFHGPSLENTVWDITNKFTAAFKLDMNLLNIEKPALWCKATDNIPEQISLVSILEKKGYTYRTSDGIYFDTAKVKDYNKLSHLPLKELKEGARVEKNPEKKNPTDFALWKFSPPTDGATGAKRQMEWESPWGIGFPGWHIECSAMSLKYLNGELDIHCGGIDHINIHHTNEIAQSEAATGQKFFNYWLHGAFLNIQGGKKMAKSEDNFLTVENALLKKGISPLVYRFAALQVHYRKPMEYSEEILQQAKSGFGSLLSQVASLGKTSGSVSKDWHEKFIEAINNDLNLPKALAVLAGVLKSKLAPADKLATALDFDKVLGLKLDEPGEELEAEISLDSLPQEVRDLVTRREIARSQKDWPAADQLRKEIEEQGYFIEDTSEGQKIKPIV